MLESIATITCLLSGTDDLSVYREALYEGGVQTGIASRLVIHDGWNAIDASVILDDDGINQLIDALKTIKAMNASDRAIQQAQRNKMPYTLVDFKTELETAEDAYFKNDYVELCRMVGGWNFKTRFTPAAFTDGTTLQQLRDAVKEWFNND